MLNELKKLFLTIWLTVAVKPLGWISGTIKHPKLRAIILRQLSALLARVISRFSLPYKVETGTDVSGEPIVTVTDGTIRLSAEGTNRYFKQSAGSSFEGYDLIDQLAEFGVSDITTMIDVGANYGEISLCFLARFPEAMIIAVEPSSANFAILNQNLQNQAFDTSNIQCFRFAASDNPKPVKITRGLGAQNSIVAKRNLAASRYEEVPTISLDVLFEQAGIMECDFLKIDIEGAEPGLVGSLAKILPKTRTLLIEFSHKNTPDAYSNVVNVFKDADTEWLCYDSIEPKKAIPLGEVIPHFTANGTKRRPVGNYWFIRR